VRQLRGRASPTDHSGLRLKTVFFMEKAGGGEIGGEGGPSGDAAWGQQG
jgi:hypothetical protein